MATPLRSVRPLTYATFIPALLTVLAMPFGLIDAVISNIAALYGLYFVLPAILAWCLDRLRSRLPRSAQRSLGVLILLVAIPSEALLLLFTGPMFIAALPSTTVVFIVAVRLLRARPPSVLEANGPATTTARTAPGG